MSLAREDTGVLATRAAVILVVDDDRRVVELLRIALEAHGYRMLAAHDGEEALQVARRERPDLVVLDVRLPKRSGFDVCERLRNDPDDPGLPILLVSAATEVETRVQGLARGADDYLTKPFSPKELVARVQRLLARTLQAREARRAGLAAERELERARADARRSQQTLEHERWLAEHTRNLGAALAGCGDPESIAEALLSAVLTGTGIESAALLTPLDDRGTLTWSAARGIVQARTAALMLPRSGALAQLLAGLDRLVTCDELTRFPELRDELGDVSTSGFTALVPLVGDELEGILLLGERPDGVALGPAARALTSALCGTAAHALSAVRHVTEPISLTVDLLSTVAASRGASPPRVTAEVWEVLAPVLRRIDARAGERRLVAWAIRLGPWAAGGEADAWLATAAGHDASGTCAALRRLLARASSLASGAAADPRDPARIIALAWRVTAERAGGVSAARAWSAALTESPDLDPTIAASIGERIRVRRRAARPA